MCGGHGLGMIGVEVVLAFSFLGLLEDGRPFWSFLLVCVNLNLMLPPMQEASHFGSSSRSGSGQSANGLIGYALALS